jgi:hypothetical protein
MYIYKKLTLMKKQILSIALIAVMISSIATSCGSSQKATTADSTGTKTVDTSKTTTPPPVDTAKRDTTKKPPM